MSDRRQAVISGSIGVICMAKIKLRDFGLKREDSPPHTDPKEG